MARSPWWKQRVSGKGRDRLVGACLFLSTFLVYRSAPVHQLHDSKYTMLLAENLRAHGDLDLARYRLPADDYHLISIGIHRYYYFPAASAALSVPFVAAMHLRGLSPVGPDGAYSEQGELAIDARLAALLMSVFACLAYAAARELLSVPWSIGIALWGALGTQVFSTASRSVWSDTWGITLVLCAIYLLLRSATRGTRPAVAAVALLAGVAYAVRPTNAAAMVGIGVYLVSTRPRLAWQYVVIVALVIGTFVVHSLSIFHQPLPPYFSASRLTFPEPMVALAGNLVSPSRGVFVYVPALSVMAFALVRYRTNIRFPREIALAMSVVLVHFALLAGFWDWWGGHSYGPRLTTSLVPWFVLLSVLAASAASDGVAERGVELSDRLLLAAGGLLCVVSVGMNAVGACSWDADRWNVVPDNINDDRARLWSWSRPQFLAPFQGSSAQPPR